MKLIFHYMRQYSWRIALGMLLKLIGALAALMLPYILEHLVDDVVPEGEIVPVYFWGAMMILSAVFVWRINIAANRVAIDNAHNVSYDVRRDLFNRTITLSGTQSDAFGLPSLISRMTSDSYNVQSFVQSFQMLCVRAPTMLIGGIIVTMTMDRYLAMILCAMVPVLLVVVVLISRKGIPLFRRVQERLDDVVRIMREFITGVRVVKALSKTDFERRRFHESNRQMTGSDIRASATMAIPGPFMQLCLNIGLTLVVFVGADRVNSGLMKPGVIMAFLTYFNQIIQSVMAVNRMFMLISKASASANRIASVLETPDIQPALPAEDGAEDPDPEAFIEFRHVNFRYGEHALTVEGKAASGEFAGGERENCLTDISFVLKRGESLGIIGPTGCGKTTIINLLMRFYDVEDGAVFVDGRDVRTYSPDELRRRFGVVFQNDMVFNDTLRENIAFGRDVTDVDISRATNDAMASEFIDGLTEGLDFVADIKGANLSGGQKQRLLISRALVGNPDILVLDDSSSALDYRTDAALRKAVLTNYSGATTVMIAQRVSSVMSLTHILVMENGHAIGYGGHSELMETCPAYRRIYDAQMGSM